MREFEVRVVEVQRVSDSSVKARPLGPLSYLALFGCVQSLALLAIFVAARDGMSILAVVALSTLSVLVGIGNNGSCSCINGAVLIDTFLEVMLSLDTPKETS